MVCSGIDKNFVDCGAFACGLALTLIFCLEVWMCVLLFAGLFVWSVEAG